jgi:hypothetical protein
VGHSYLVHLLNGSNRTLEEGFSTEVSFKTSHAEGILFYTGERPHQVTLVNSVQLEIFNQILFLPFKKCFKTRID